jgi:ArsR family transcriptional regulator
MMNRQRDPSFDLPGCNRGDHRAAGPARTPPAPAVLARAAGMLRAAGDPARLALLDLLVEGERCVSDLATTTGDAMPTVSQRLRLLRSEGLVAARREGKHVFYALSDAHVHELLANVLRHAGEPVGG